ncbi:MAG: sensor histidine kinase [Bacteroidales bacterium]|nr:sensor histidine kinase [Bacteroidales bacterium]
MNTRRCLFLCSLWLLCFPAAARDAIRLSNKNVLDVQIDALDRVWVGTLGGQDSGRGIPEDVKVHLFDPYYKPEDDAPDSPDTVIGLALVKKLCDLHKIDIALTSRLGQGSEFRMLINPAEHYPEALHPELSRE